MPLNQELNIEIVPEKIGFESRARDIFLDVARSCIDDKGVFYLAISGGQTPARFFELLSEIQDASLWENIHIFWVDERYIPSDVDGNNYKLANDTFLTKVPIPPQNIHRIPTEYSDFRLALQEYEQDIRKTFGLDKSACPVFDLIILGMGADAHTGSLFPNSYASFDAQNIACVVYTMDQEFSRITLTHPVLTAANHIVVLVSGREKAKILKEVLTSAPDEVKYPIHVLWPVLDKVTWLIDSQAAKLL
jgi:6-phosphogluconolactonase